MTELETALPITKREPSPELDVDNKRSVIGNGQPGRMDVNNAWRRIPKQDVVELSLGSIHRECGDRSEPAAAGDCRRLVPAHVEVTHEHQRPAQMRDVARDPPEL